MWRPCLGQGNENVGAELQGIMAQKVGHGLYHCSGTRLKLEERNWGTHRETLNACPGSCQCHVSTQSKLTAMTWAASLPEPQQPCLSADLFTMSEKE
jgi:hypothetical protein